MYEKKYVPLGKYEETHGYSFCQMIDVGRKFVMHNIRGYLPTQTVHYLQHFNLFPRPIWLSRHGESIDDAAGRIGGDSNLSLLGIKYAKALTDFIEHQRKVWIDETFDPDHAKRSFQPDNAEGMHAQSFHVWTSNMRRSSQTAQFFDTSNYEVESLRMLDELNAGILEGFTRNEVKEFYSDWLKEREGDKLRCRYPGTGGEGYLDVTNRLRSVILEVERLTDHVLLISGLAVTRVLLAYFRGLQRDEITELHAPLGTIYKLEPVRSFTNLSYDSGLQAWILC
jgi:6-phosphofructo-2-kinase